MLFILETLMVVAEEIIKCFVLSAGAHLSSVHMFSVFELCIPENECTPHKTKTSEANAKATKPHGGLLGKD